MNKPKTNILFFALLIFSKLLCGQGFEEYGEGLKIKFNESGSKYLRFVLWNQIWTRAIELNPGSIIHNQPLNWHYDISIRRARFMAFSQISPRFLILLHWGINNQTFINGGVPFGGLTGNGGAYTSGKKPGLFLHDLWNEFAVFPEKNPKTQESSPHSLYIGNGLHYWHGVSRLTNASTLTFMTIDAPIFNWFTIEIMDQFARYLGIYAKGRLFNRLDYRMHLSKPFATEQSLPLAPDRRPILNRAVDNNSGSNAWLQAAYLSYRFFEKESNLLPFTVGTYIGSKKILNCGVGFQRIPNATQHWSLKDKDTVAARNNALVLGLDFFLDYPLSGDQNSALTVYSVFYNHTWGPNYYRSIGIMNEASSVKDPFFQGPINPIGFGNARPLLGTGQIWYTQAGYLLPRNLFQSKNRAEPNKEKPTALERNPGKYNRLQIFGAYALHNLEYLGIPVHSFDLGFNYFIAGHHAKITFQYSARPDLIANPSFQQKGWKSEIIIQTQIYL